MRLFLYCWRGLGDEGEVSKEYASNKKRLVEQRQKAILRKLAGVGAVSMLELGFNATPQFIRDMAARGLVRVTVEITPCGQSQLPKLDLKDMRRHRREEVDRHGLREVA